MILICRLSFLELVFELEDMQKKQFCLCSLHPDHHFYIVIIIIIITLMLWISFSLVSV